ncbi:hypothetical protein OAK45_00145 [Verrucomicrobia bacterium]|nr:hypothetical protein [Verrucomicrobiota bacterium]
MHYVTRIVCHGALGLLLFAVGCKTVVRFATGTITSGGNPVAGAQNAAVGLAVDVVTNPGGEAAQAPQIITVLVPETGLQKVVPWREGMTVYTARRTAGLNRPPGPCKIERGDERLEGTNKALLEPGDVLRFVAP